MRVCFLEPPPVTERNPERFAGCTYEVFHFPDLGNLYPFTLLHREGVEVDYLDAALLGDDAAAFEARLRRRPADMYVLHAVVLAKPTDRHWIARLRALQPEAWILLHGPEATRVPEEYVGRDPRVVVFRGEVERTLVDFAAGRGEGRWGQARWDQDQGALSVSAPDPRGLVPFDELPIPARDHPALLPYRDRYFNPKYKGRPHTLMLTSRGCSFRCAFCVPNAISFQRELEHVQRTGRKPPVAKASPARVEAEFRWLAERGYRSVHVADDQFLWAKRRTLEICERVAPYGLEWGMLSRADFLTDEAVVRALARAGCTSVDIGVESLSQRVLDAIHKDLDVADVYAAVRLLRRHGISPKLNIMFGTTPGETPADILATLRELKRMDVTNVMFSIATPFKGTPFFERCLEAGYLIDTSDAINPLGKAVVSYPGLSARQLEELERLAYRSFYLRPKVIWERLRRLRSPRDLWEDLKVARHVLLH